MVEYESHWKREFSLFYGAACLYGLQYWIKKDLGIDAHLKGEGEEGKFFVWSEKGIIEKLNQRLKKMVKDDPQILEREIKELKDIGEEFIHFAKK